MAHPYLLEHGRLFQEGLGLLLGAKSHDALHAGPFVPVPVQQLDQSGSRQVEQVLLRVSELVCELP